MSARTDGSATRAATGAADEALLDGMRAERIGLDEAIFAHSKSVRQLTEILATAEARGLRLLITRLGADKHAELARRWSDRLDYCPVSATAFFGVAAGRAAGTARAAAVPSVAIVAAGTSDAAVAREAERTLEFNGIASSRFIDVGVAGLWRLTRALPAIAAHPVVIAVAGMDAALPTVLGGLVGALIIAVPTSVGYGVAAGGRTALDAILSSCAPGIPVMNIDNGYGAACAAVRALRALPALRAASQAAPCGGDHPEDSTQVSHRRAPCNVDDSYPPRSPASASPRPPACAVPTPPRRRPTPPRP